MKKFSTTLSIIIPCYNVSSTIERALDSILFQQIDFSYEIICVNDASTDDSASKISDYAKKYENIKLLHNPENLGNAGTFYNGLKAAKGKYFTVLDGDDFYCFRTKLQQQVNFFESDIHAEYCAVTHYFLFYKNDGTVSVPKFDLTKTEYSYRDFLDNKAQYHHTATYMFRNIYDGNPPDILKEEKLRGDTPRLILQLLYTNKKIKVLQFFGSVYNYTNTGIWSGMTYEKQLEKNINCYSALKELVNNDYEKFCLGNAISSYTKYKEKYENYKDESTPVPEPEGIKKDVVLRAITKNCEQFAFGSKQFAFHSLYKNTVYDSLCACLGYIQMLELGCDVLAKPSSGSNAIMIVVRMLNHQGGGIFAELCEIAAVFKNKGKDVFIFCTEADCNTPEAKIYLEKTGIKILSIPDNADSRLEYAFRKMTEIKPERVYFYVGHNNPIIDCLVQPSLSYNIHVFSYDHGFVLGIANPNFNNFMVKRAVDVKLLKNNDIKNINFIPAWIQDVQYNIQYKPFRFNKNITTASAAARWYKCEGTFPCNYLELVLSSILETGGRHIHYGKMPDHAVRRVQDFLKEHHLPEDSFVNIAWADNLGLSLLENGVDVFIEPFPVVSAKISIIVQSAGIPVLRYAGRTRMTVADFVYDKAFSWSTPASFIQTLLSLDAKILEQHSFLAVSYFNKCHSFGTISPHIYDNYGFDADNAPDFVDDFIPEANFDPLIDFYPQHIDSIKLKVFLLRLELIYYKIVSMLFHNTYYRKNKFHLRNIIKNNGKIYYIDKFSLADDRLECIKLKPFLLKLELIFCKIALLFFHKDYHKDKIAKLKNIMINKGKILYINGKK
ncbi:MAG: glycosyltransferase family 2 protein [Desulfovibrionaceae bacterium]|nr:glycosyltransferase family 2 protein [Desulfovibrionaceae bacterium]